MWQYGLVIDNTESVSGAGEIFGVVPLICGF